MPAAGLTVGKRSDNDLVLDDPHVSRSHARFHWQAGALFVTDLGSTNGTRVNNVMIDARVLQHDDRIEIGGSVFRYRDQPQAVIHESSGNGAAPQASVVLSVHRAAEVGTVLGQPPASAVEADSRLGDVARALTELARTRPGTLSTEAMLARILGLVFEFVQVDRGCILLLDQDGIPRTRAVCNRDGSVPDEDMPLSGTLVKQALDSGNALLIPDAMSDPGLANVASVMLHALRCIAYVPFCFGDESLGLLCVDSSVPGSLEEPDLEGLVAFANQAALVAYQARLQDAVTAEVNNRNRLQRFLGKAVAERYILEGKEPELGGEQRDITILFADLRGYTSLTEEMDPVEALSLLNTLFEHLCAPILRHGGTVDKYIGDCVMAIFNAPIDDAHHCLRAVQAAIDMQRAMGEFKESLADKYGSLEIGIAINTGSAVVGNIGTEQKMDYTAIGDAVNVAARLEDIAGKRQILVTEAVAKKVSPFVDLQPTTKIQLRGRQQETTVYAITGIKQAAPAESAVT